jgi:signal transduction histidine kinase
LSATQQDGWAIVTLADTGPGIAPEDQAHLFEPFYRASRPLAVSGAGLGLAIVKAIVEAHGGRVALESLPGAGMTISFALPISDDEGAPGAALPATGVITERGEA